MEKEIVVTFSKRRKFFILLINLSFISLALVMSFVLETALILRIISLVTFFSFLGMFVIIVYRTFFKKVALIINNEGIIDNSNPTTGLGLIKWSEIRGIQQIEYNGSTVIKILLFEPIEFVERYKNKIVRFFLKTNYKIYQTPVVIPMIMLNIYVDNLEQIIIKKLEEYRATNVTN